MEIGCSCIRASDAIRSASVMNFLSEQKSATLQQFGEMSESVRVHVMQIAPPEIRGQMGSLNQLTICFGILAALVVNVVFPPTAWRTMFWIATLPAAILLFGEPLDTQSLTHLAMKRLQLTVWHHNFIAS